MSYNIMDEFIAENDRLVKEWMRKIDLAAEGKKVRTGYNAKSRRRSK